MAETSYEMSDDIGVGAVASGFVHLLLSQLSTRIISFILNLVIARHLTPEAYGMSAVQFHLITTTILLLSREGLRRGCLRFRPENGQSSTVDARRVMSVAWLALPAGLVVSLAVVFSVLHWSDSPADSVYRNAVILHGVAGLLELAAEPFYAIALVNLRFQLRAGVDTAALLTKSGLTLVLVSQTSMAPAMIFSLAQIAFAFVTLLSYLAFTLKDVMASLQKQDEATAVDVKKSTRPAQGLWGPKEREVLWMSGLFTFQAMEKQVLAEGSKMVLVAVQSKYNQGVYGLVGNLGSLLVRMLFQPLEEIAFATFSRFQVGINEARHAQGKVEHSTSHEQQQQRLSDVLTLLVKAVCLLGLLSASFGPAYSYTLIRLMYGTQWSETEAPAVLACYSVYILLLSLNGVTEAFVHAVLDGRGIQQTNLLMVAFSILHLVASVFFIKLSGAVGLVLADSINMILRVCCSMWYIRNQFRGTKGFRLAQLLPRFSTLLAFSASSVLCWASERFLLTRTDLPGMSSLGFLRHSSSHILVGMISLAVCATAVYQGERSLIHGIRNIGRKSKEF